MLGSSQLFLHRRPLGKLGERLRGWMPRASALGELPCLSLLGGHTGRGVRSLRAKAGKPHSGAFCNQIPFLQGRKGGPCCVTVDLVELTQHL